MIDLIDIRKGSEELYGYISKTGQEISDGS